MADNLVGPLAQTPLVPGMKIVLEALHPSTGASVAGVQISNVVISGVPLLGAGGGAEFIETGPPRLIPA